MNWIQQIKSWNRLRKFVREHRTSGISSFRMLTTGNELIIYDDPPDKDHPNKTDEQLRLKY